VIPVNVVFPPTENAAPTLTFLAMPIPPETMIAPFPVVVESVVSVKDEIPENVALTDPAVQLKPPLPS